MKLSDVYPKLIAEFNKEDIKIMPGAMTKDRSKALALCYIDARTVMDRLDEAVGPDNWEFDYVVLPISSPEHMYIQGRLTVLDVIRSDAGEAAAKGNDGEELLKAAVSDALKRVAVQFGIGRFLYSMPQAWLSFDGRKFTEPYPFPARFLGQEKKSQANRTAASLSTKGQLPSGLSELARRTVTL